jgi:CRISPR-associated protein Csm2
MAESESQSLTCRKCQYPLDPKRDKDGFCQRCRLDAAFDEYIKELHAKQYLLNGHLRPELRVEQADIVAQKLVRAQVTMGQLRRFFLMARSIERMNEQQTDFAALASEIAAFRPLAAYVAGRPQLSGNLGVLKQFIDANAELAGQSKENFLKGFLPHFESVVAYFTYHSNKQPKGGGQAKGGKKSFRKRNR